MFDHLSTLMTLQYVKDKVMGEEHGFITMEMCHRVLTSKQGGNFHLKVGGAKSSGNTGDPLLGVAVVP